MCLNINKKVHVDNPKKAFIARGDIVVYKILRRKYKYTYNQYTETTTTHAKYQAPYQYFFYEMGKLYETLGMKVDTFLSVDAGLHSFKTLRAANRRNNEGVHGTVFPAIIPKGSRVFVGTCSELVSNRLIVYKDKKDLEAKHGKIHPRITLAEGLR